MSRIWLPLLILAVCVSGFFFLVEPESDTALGTENPVTPKASSQQEIAPAETVVLPTQGEEMLARTTEEKEPANLDPRPYANPVDQGGVLITVVDSETLEPLPHAFVIVLDGEVVNLKEFADQRQWELDFPRLFRRFGQAYKTNELAQVRIPEPGGFLILAGESYTHFDFVSGVDYSSGEYTLPVTPLEYCTVQVLDPFGKPMMGVRVVLCRRDHGFDNQYVFAVSNAEGLAKLNFFRVMREQMGENTFVKALLISNEKVEVPMDLKNLPEVPPVLAMPPTGSLQVSILDKNRRRVNELYFTSVEILDGDLSEYPAPSGSLGEGGNRTSYGNDKGFLEFHHVELGLNLGVLAATPTRDSFTSTAIAGPTSPGEQVHVELTPQIHNVVLTGRLVNTEGRVGKNIQASAQIRSTSQPNELDTPGCSTNEEGMFRILMDTAFEQGGKRTCKIVLEKSKNRPMRAAMIDLSFPIEPGEYELGDVILEQPPLLARGTVVDLQGNPIAQVRLSTQTSHSSMGSPDLANWRIDRAMNVRSAKDGTFEIHGYAEDLQYRVVTRHNDYRESTVDIVPGTKDLVIPLKSAGDVSGTILADAGIRFDDMRVTLILHSGNVRSRSLRPSKDGTFSLRDLNTNYGDLSVTSRATGEVFAEYLGIDLFGQGAGNQAIEIDLRGQLFYRTLTVTDSQGENFPQFLTRAASGNGGQSHKRPASILTRGGKINLEVSSAGYRSQTLEYLDRDYTLILQHGTPVRLFLSNAAELPENIYLEIKLIEDSVPGNTGRPFLISLKEEADGYWHGVTGQSGPFRLQTMLSKKKNGKSFGTQYGVGDTPVFFEVFDSGSGNELSHTLPEDVLSRARSLSQKDL